MLLGDSLGEQLQHGIATAHTGELGRPLAGPALGDVGELRGVVGLLLQRVDLERLRLVGLVGLEGDLALLLRDLLRALDLGLHLHHETLDPGQLGLGVGLVRTGGLDLVPGRVVVGRGGDRRAGDHPHHREDRGEPGRDDGARRLRRARERRLRPAHPRLLVVPPPLGDDRLRYSH